MDGTALQNDHKTVSGRMRRAMEEAISTGLLLVPTSGRPFTFLPEPVCSVPGLDYVIASNGAVIYSLKQRRALWGAYVSGEDALWILRSLPDSSLAEIWVDGKIRIPDFRTVLSRKQYPNHVIALRQLGEEVGDLLTYVKQHPENIEKINVPVLTPEERIRFVKLFSGRQGLSVLDTGSGIELMSAGVTKASGLRNLCRLLDEQRQISIKPEEILAIGDSSNDVEMLRESGIGVAMENGEDPAKQAADHTTLSNLKDGAALAIETYALNR